MPREIRQQLIGCWKKGVKDEAERTFQKIKQWISQRLYGRRNDGDKTGSAGGDVLEMFFLWNFDLRRRFSETFQMLSRVWKTFSCSLINKLRDACLAIE